MRTIRTTALATLTAGLVVMALAGCAEPESSPSGSPSPLPTSGGVQAVGAPTPAASGRPTPAPTPSLQKAPLTGGSTQIALDPSFAAELRTLHVTPAAAGKASLQGTTLSLPVTGGSLLLFGGGTVEGTLQHSASGITLQGSGRTVRLTDLVVVEGPKPYVTGNVVGGAATAARGVVLFDLDPSAMATPSATGGQVVFSNVNVTLTPGAATVLNTRLGTTALPGSLRVGVATITAD